jgi:hypothetical protein
MNISSDALWSIYHQLSVGHKLFVLILVVVSVYSIITAGSVLRRVRSLAASGNNETRSSVQHCVAALDRRCLNLRQLLWAAFFLFGFLFFLELPQATFTPDGRESVGFMILGNFLLRFVYAANIFCVLLVLHVVQWFTWSRVRACATREVCSTQG